METRNKREELLDNIRIISSAIKNIESEKEILNRQIRSIQTEGHFGDIKENENFRRFNYRSSDKMPRNKNKISTFYKRACFRS